MENKNTIAFEERSERELDILAKARAECVTFKLGAVCKEKDCARCPRGIKLDYLYARSSSIDQARVDVLMKKHLNTAVEEAIKYRVLKPQNVDFSDDKSIRKFIYRPIKWYLILFIIIFIFAGVILLL